METESIKQKRPREASQGMESEEDSDQASRGTRARESTPKKTIESCKSKPNQHVNAIKDYIRRLEIMFDQTEDKNKKKKMQKKSKLILGKIEEINAQVIEIIETKPTAEVDLSEIKQLINEQNDKIQKQSRKNEAVSRRKEPIYASAAASTNAVKVSGIKKPMLVAKTFKIQLSKKIDGK